MSVHQSADMPTYREPRRTHTGDDDIARQYSTMIRRLQDTRDRLLQAASRDELLAQAITAGQQLGFERLSLWLTDQQNEAVGTYGTDEEGALRDERGSRLRVRPESLMGRILAQEARLLVRVDDLLLNQFAEKVGSGSHAVAALWDGSQVIGVLSADTFISGRRFTQVELDMLELYASMLGHLITEAAMRTALRDRESLYHGIFNAIPDVFFRTDLSGRINLVSPSVERWLGVPPEAILGACMRDFETDPQRYERFMTLMLHDGRVADFEAVIPGINQQLITISINAQLLRDAEGKPIGIEGTWRDVTERQRIVESLQDTQHLLRLLLDNTPSPVFVRSADGIVLLANRALAELYGLTPAEVAGKSQAELFARIQVPQAETQRALAEDREVLADGLPTLRIREFYEPRGDVHYFRTLRCRITLRDGTPAVLVLSEDITERKQTGDALKASEARYRRIVETAQEGIFHIDAAGYLTYVNYQMAAMLGYTIDEMMHQQVYDYLDGETVSQALSFANRRLEGYPGTLDFRLSRKDGSLVWLSVSLMPMLMENGDLLGLLGMATDITARKEADDAQRRGQALLMAGVEMAQAPVFAIQADGRLWFTNAAMKAFMEKYCIYDLHACRLVSMMDGDDVPLDQWPITRALNGETLERLSFEMQTDGDMRVPVIISASPARVDGAVIGAVVIFHTRMREEG